MAALAKPDAPGYNEVPFPALPVSPAPAPSPKPEQRGKAVHLMEQR